MGCALGLQAACLEASIKFSNERILYGKPISNLQTIQNKIAEMKIDLEAGRLLGYRAASIQDKGKSSSNEFAVAKYFTTEASQKAAKMAVDIHGGYGCMEEYAVSRYIRDAFRCRPLGRDVRYHESDRSPVGAVMIQVHAAGRTPVRPARELRK